MAEPAPSGPCRLPIAACLGVAWWKRRRLGEFFGGATMRPVFCRGTAAAVRIAAVRGGAIGVWASREPPGLAAAAAARGVPLVRIEDGFLRSVGLGADFLPPASLVFDTSGIYCDAQRPGDLERLLRETDFDADLLVRARRLIDRLGDRGITKYNLAGRRRTRIAWPPARERILVPGQVEDDLSVRRGGGEPKGNLALLARVRAANPDAFIVYKPHPDVLAGHRRGAVPRDRVLRHADAIVTDMPMACLLGETDALHTLTSLSGFEALLRGVPVTAYGRPFYAGWGLTEDRAPIDRGRRLTLEELAAGALILYPRYLDPLTRRLCEPETLVERLAEPALWRPGPVVLARRAQGWLAERIRLCAPRFARL